ncbi:EF hand domain-containing protein [Spironucleus salmonicida]|uniref:EF hand domain-containing protein n=1 Tax=Spironucleus salmonicida TaxID=348837 RepID=V6LKR3_9EUKA|nr:EF hand domain-containing protein [Spironucleus salmonicida]|eukprot:EST44953.1 EF hand domain-containing protein [Spironucleus salmonicida]
MIQNLPIYHSIFDEIDTDKSGEVDLVELRCALNQLNINMGDSTLNQLVSIVNVSDKPSMNRQEFVHFLYIFENADPKNIPQILFLAADSDFSGNIDVEELFFIIKKLDGSVQKDDIKFAMDKLATNGQMNYDTFSKIVSKLVEK